MKRLFFLAAVCLLLISCGGTRIIHVPVESTVTVREVVRDTLVHVQLEREYVRQMSTDTISVVGTRYATSTAIWHSERAILEHTIENRDVEIPVRVQYVEIHTESEIQIPFPVYIATEVNVLTRWQRFRLWIGNILLILAVGYGGYKVFKLKRLKR